MTVRFLEAHLSDVEEPGKLSSFKWSFKQSVAVAGGIDREDVTVLDVRAGSVVVDALASFAVHNGGREAAQKLAERLERDAYQVFRRHIPQYTADLEGRVDVRSRVVDLQPPPPPFLPVAPPEAPYSNTVLGLRAPELLLWGIFLMILAFMGDAMGKVLDRTLRDGLVRRQTTRPRRALAADDASVEMASTRSRYSTASSGRHVRSTTRP